MNIAEQIRAALGKNFPLDAHGELAVQEIERLRAENETLRELRDIAKARMGNATALHLAVAAWIKRNAALAAKGE